MSSHYRGTRRRGREARNEAPRAVEPGPRGPGSVTSSDRRLAVLGQAPRDLLDARLTSARVLGTPRAGRRAVSHGPGAADWLRHRRGGGAGRWHPLMGP